MARTDEKAAGSISIIRSTKLPDNERMTGSNKVSDDEIITGSSKALDSEIITGSSKASDDEIIIGSADGPTSIFIAGKLKSGKSEENKKKLAAEKAKRCEEIKKLITPGTHTLDELADYITEKYGAVCADESYMNYTNIRNSVKTGLVNKHRPELIEVEKPEKLTENEFGDHEKMREFFEKIDEWSAAAAAVSEEEFPIDFSLYVIKKSAGEGKLEITVAIERNYEVLGVSASYAGAGQDTLSGEIMRDIYMYYGVSEKDMADNTERFMELVSAFEADRYLHGTKKSAHRVKMKKAAACRKTRVKNCKKCKAGGHGSAKSGLYGSKKACVSGDKSSKLCRNKKNNLNEARKVKLCRADLHKKYICKTNRTAKTLKKKYLTAVSSTVSCVAITAAVISKYLKRR